MVGYLYPEVSKYVAKIFCCWDDVVTCENYISVKCLLISVSQSVTKVSRRPKFNVALMSGRNPHMFINEYENTFVWVSRQNDLTLFLSTLNVKKGGVGLKLEYVIFVQNTGHHNHSSYTQKGVCLNDHDSHC